MSMKFRFSRYSRAVERFFGPRFANEGDAGGGGGTPGSGGGTPGSDGGGKPAPKMLSQDEVNNILAAERKKRDERDKATLAELEALKRNKNLSEEEKASLQHRIDELEGMVMTKEEKAKKELEDARKKHEADLRLAQEREKHWQTQYAQSTVERALLDAAIDGKAFNPTQVVDLLRSKSELVEVKDKVGRPTGKYAVVVKVQVADAEGNVTEEQLDTKKAVEVLKGKKEYENLFLADRPGGTGFRPSAGGQGAGAAKLTSRQKIAEGLRSRR